MIPDGWKVEPFGNFISSAQNGFGRRPNGEENGYIVLRIADVTNGFVDISDVRRINMIGKEFDTYQIHKNDLLFVRVNGSRDCVAQCVLVDKEYSDVAFNDHLIRVKLKEGLNSNFVRYVFRSEHIRSKLLSYIPMAQGGQLTVNQASLSCVQIPIPPLLEQCRIAEVLGVWDESIDLLERLIGRVRSRKQGLMQQLLTGKKRFKEFEDSEYSIVKLSEVAKIRRGASPRPIQDPKWFAEKGRGWVRIRDVTASNTYLMETTQYLSNLAVEKSVKVDPGDLIMSICATIGVPRIVGIPACIHDGFVVFREFEQQIDKFFLYHYINLISAKISDSGQPGTQKNINTTIVGNIEVPKFSIPEQEKIAAVLSAADEEISTLEKQLAAYKQQKLGLMQQLLTGRIRI